MVNEKQAWGKDKIDPDYVPQKPGTYSEEHNRGFQSKNFEHQGPSFKEALLADLKEMMPLTLYPEKIIISQEPSVSVAIICKQNYYGKGGTFSEVKVSLVGNPSEDQIQQSVDKAVSAEEQTFRKLKEKLNM